MVDERQPYDAVGYLPKPHESRLHLTGLASQRSHQGLPLTHKPQRGNVLFVGGWLCVTRLAVGDVANACSVVQPAVAADSELKEPHTHARASGTMPSAFAVTLIS